MAPSNDIRRDDGRQPRRDVALRSLAALILSALVFAILYSLWGGTGHNGVGRLAVAALTGGAATMIGGLLGFLFGIPRTLQGDSAEDSRRHEGSSAESVLAYRPNTSLEQISDWLTKILVGVGLTQIGAIETHFSNLGQNLGRAFGGQPADEAFITSLVAMLLVAGFLFGFLWTRIYLPGAFRTADLEALRGEVRQELNRQADSDVEALSLVDQQLSSTPGQPAVSEEKLVAAISSATANTRLFVFERAREFRHKNWQSGTKLAIERSIPVFRALIKSGADSPIAHRYYGQLGFALKDQTNPDFAAAKDALDTAIKLRSSLGSLDFGYAYYELNRAVCQVELDKAFKDAKPSDPAVKASIISDLRIVFKEGLAETVQREPKLVEWLSLNTINQADLAKK